MLSLKLQTLKHGRHRFRSSPLLGLCWRAGSVLAAHCMNSKSSAYLAVSGLTTGPAMNQESNSNMEMFFFSRNEHRGNKAVLLITQLWDSVDVQRRSFRCHMMSCCALSFCFVILLQTSWCVEWLDTFTDLHVSNLKMKPQRQKSKPSEKTGNKEIRSDLLSFSFTMSNSNKGYCINVTQNDLSFASAAMSTREIKLPDNRKTKRWILVGFHNTDRLTLGSNAFIHLILCSACSGNFISLCTSASQTHWFFVCIFAPSLQKLLTFHAQFNKCLNKQKQILSGGKWHESLLARCFPPWFPPVRQGWWLLLLRSSTLINYERFTFDNKDILKKSAIFPPQYETTPGWLQSHTPVKRNKRWVWDEKL